MSDVCLVVEGSYPHITGGVSVWADRLIRGLPELDFSVVHAGEPRTGEPAFELPGNVSSMVCLPVDEDHPGLGISSELPEARVYHAACTGTAGELARRAARRAGAGLMLTEHGIGAREAWWGASGCGPHGGGETSRDTLAERARRVGRLARDTYRDADAITSVCAANLPVQVALGAPSERLRVVPNAAPRLGSPATPDAEPPPTALTVGCVGRLARVKDVAAFVRACAVVAEQRPETRFLVVGPDHHEPAYAERCRELARGLGLDERLEFTGERSPEEWTARLDVLVLTSRSEAQPLVALEAMAAGIPVVATAVGGCAETIGDAGLLTAPGSTRDTARAILRLAGDPALRARLGGQGRRRARRHDPAAVHGAYRSLYERVAA